MLPTAHVQAMLATTIVGLYDKQVSGNDTTDAMLGNMEVIKAFALLKEVSYRLGSTLYIKAQLSRQHVLVV